MKSILLAALFIFSGDGATVGSSPRELPTQGVSLATGQVVVGLHALGDAERAECGWYRVLPGEKPVAQSNEVWRVSGYAFSTNGTAMVTGGIDAMTRLVSTCAAAYVSIAGGGAQADATTAVVSKVVGYFTSKGGDAGKATIDAVGGAGKAVLDSGKTILDKINPF